MNDVTKMEAVVFEAALAISDLQHRDAMLEAACRDDPALRQRIDELLAASEDSNSFMQQPAVTFTDETRDSLPAEQPGTQIGRYKLLEKIGEGGFGVVYMADQLRPIERRVALKIIKLGMDSKQVVARFEAERQALALMDHPHIAKILDAGTTANGRPYFVMELVRGIPVTEYCDDRGLTTAQRLKLFSQICAAVQHAHQKGIIHRDLKPTNILVATNGDDAVPKVIDFGIAKATQGRLTDKTLFTQFRQFIGTPAYMSPEQAQMSAVDVDTRSDIYSLGVLLYELLTGKTPLDSTSLATAGYEEICRRIREEEAMKPSKRLSSLQQQELSTLAKQRNISPAQFTPSVRGDLDWIVMRAVDKDRSRRYESCGALAADVERYLNKEPVTAGPPGAAYHLRKFVQRHRTAVLTTLVFALLLSSGAFVASVGWLRAIEAKTKLSSALDQVTGSRNQAKLAQQKAEDAEAEAEQRARRLAKSEAFLRKNLYATEMAAAKRATDQLRTGRVTELLEKQIPNVEEDDLRNFEWRFLWQQCNRDVIRLQPNRESGLWGTDGYRDIRFSQDGRLLATGSTDGFARIWDVANQKEIWSFKGGHHCNGVDFTRDGRFFLAYFWRISAHTATFIWEFNRTQSPINSLISQSETDATRFWVDGESVVDAEGKRFDFQGSQLDPAFNLEKDGIDGWADAFSHDYESESNTRWDASTFALGEYLSQSPDFVEIGPMKAAMSPVNRDLIVTGSPAGICVWDKDQLRRKIPFADAMPISGLGFSNDGSLLAVRLQLGAIRILETKTWSEIDIILSPPGSHVVFSPKEKDLVLTCCSDGTIRGYRVSTHRTTNATLKHPQGLLAMKYSPDGEYLAVAMSDGAIRIWDAKRNEEIFTTPPTRRRFHTSPYETGFGADFFAFSPDSRFVAVIGPEPIVSIWSLASHSVVAKYQAESNDEIIFNNEYHALCFSRDGKRLFGSVRGATRSETVSKNGMWEARSPIEGKATHWRNFAHIDVWNWSPKDGLALTDEYAGHVKSFAISADGRWLAGPRFYKQTPLVWELPTMRPLPPFELVAGAGQSARFSPDGSLLAIGGTGVTVWNISTQKIAASLPHDLFVRSVAWSPDGGRLVSSDAGAVTKLWDVETQQVVSAFRGSIACFSRDGATLAVGGQGSTYVGAEDRVGDVKLHEAPSLETIDQRRLRQTNPN